jgi:hypothetical protein
MTFVTAQRVQHNREGSRRYIHSIGQMGRAVVELIGYGCPEVTPRRRGQFATPSGDSGLRRSSNCLRLT